MLKEWRLVAGRERNTLLIIHFSVSECNVVGFGGRNRGMRFAQITPTHEAENKIVGSLFFYKKIQDI